MRIGWIWIAAFAILGLPSSWAEAGANLYVSPGGNDRWSGLYPEVENAGADGPLRTLEEARDRLRLLRAQGSLPPGTATVTVRAGLYFRNQTFSLGAEDSGSAEDPVVYRAAPGETVRFIGGRDAVGWSLVQDPEILARIPLEASGAVFQTDLKAQGIEDFGTLSPRGFGGGGPSHLELFFRNEPMPLARWPNEGWALIADVPAGKDGGRFTYSGDRPERWTEAKDLWLHGLWTWDWADSYVCVDHIDLAGKEIYTKPPHGVYGYTKDRRYYALNLLEELDQPGEWYLDRETGVLYFWPPSRIEESPAFVSLLDRLAAMEETSYVTLQGFTFEVTRATAVTIKGGTHNRILDCVIRNTGNDAINLSGGTFNQIAGCEIYNTADAGISLSGGDRMTLEPGNHEVVDCHIHHFSRWCKTYRPGVSVNGVGNRVAHNLIHDAPHNAIQLSGNEHLIEYNEIHHVCRETGDVGAFYMGRDWTQRGNVVRFNFFHHIGGFTPEGERFAEAMSIYLDDWSSGTTIYGNVCYKGGRAILIGGGRDNRVENNILVDCAPAIHVDSRGLGWAKNYFDGTTTTLTDRMRDVRADKPPYSERYPELLTLYDDEPAVAKGNVIVRNVCVGGRWLDLLNDLTEEIVTLQDNFTEGDPLFVDPENLNFNLQENSPVFATGFKPIPFDKIGPRKSMEGN